MKWIIGICILVGIVVLLFKSLQPPKVLEGLQLWVCCNRSEGEACPYGLEGRICSEPEFNETISFLLELPRLKSYFVCITRNVLIGEEFLPEAVLLNNGSLVFECARSQNIDLIAWSGRVPNVTELWVSMNVYPERLIGLSDAELLVKTPAHSWATTIGVA